MVTPVGINVRILCPAVPQLPEVASLFLFGLYFAPARSK